MAVLTLLDLSSAFDTIDHYILLHRLQSLYGVSGTLLSWLESYLTGRTQTVTVNDRITCRCFIRCPTGLSSWSYPLHSLLCTSLLFDWNSFCLQPVFCRRHTTTSLLSCSSDARRCPDHADMHLWPENLDDTKQSETEWRQDRGSPYKVKQNQIFLTLSPPLLVVPTFLLRPALASLVSRFWVSLDNHISNVCRSAFVKIRRISFIRQYLSVEATKFSYVPLLSPSYFIVTLLSSCSL